MEETVDGVQQTLAVIQNDSTLMFIGGIALAVLLAIVLVVVVSSLRVKSYKDRFKNLLLENKEKSEYITKIEKELQEHKLKETKNRIELAQFDETKNTLYEANEAHTNLKKSFDENKKELSQVKTKLEDAEARDIALKKEHKDLQERFEVSNDENIKHRVNNGRLLTKLEKLELKKG